MKESELIMSVGGLPPMSAYGCKQSLFPAEIGEVLRDINGELVCLGNNARKYRSVITGQDTNSVALDGLWIGAQIQIGCIQMLWICLDEGIQNLHISRPAVEGSVVAADESGNRLEIESIDGTDLRLRSATTEKSFVGFRPWLTMRVVNFIMQTDEWGNACSWKIILEEV
ncbi:MAG: hypothetical protein LBJ03_02120 [Holosporales bacterium]|jgi:hypothetical protein|nr:hypothetical protein [Holosporales bacterium]